MSTTKGPVLFTIGALLIGVALGMFVAGQLEKPGSERLEGGSKAAILEEQSEGTEVEIPGTARPRRSADSAPSQAATGTDAPDSGLLISPALEAYARDGIAQGWTAKRQDQISTATLDHAFEGFVRTVLGMPSSIGIRLAVEQIEREAVEAALESGDATGLLAHCDAKSEAPPWEILEDPKRLEEFLVPRSPEKVVPYDLDLPSMRKALDDGATFEFGAGVFDLKELVGGLRVAEKKDLADLGIRGAGMNNTLLVLPSDISTAGNIERLRISDCTIHCNDNYLFDQRRGVVVIDCERVRFVGFDMGAGGSSMISAKQGLAFMRDCEILGGYSRAQVGSGKLMDIRSEGNGSRFERCKIKQIAIASHLRGRHSFVNCHLEEILDQAPRFETNPVLKLVGCTISYYESSDPETRMHKTIRHDLNELFPDWKQRMQ